MAHIISAFVQANSLCLVQVSCDGKGRELDAIEKLLGLLDVKGAVVSIHAIGGSASDPQGQWSGELFAAESCGIEPVKGGENAQEEHSGEAKAVRVECGLPAKRNTVQRSITMESRNP